MQRLAHRHYTFFFSLSILLIRSLIHWGWENGILERFITPYLFFLTYRIIFSASLFSNIKITLVLLPLRDNILLVYFSSSIDFLSIVVNSKYEIVSQTSTSARRWRAPAGETRFARTRIPVTTASVHRDTLPIQIRGSLASR